LPAHIDAQTIRSTTHAIAFSTFVTGLSIVLPAVTAGDVAHTQLTCRGAIKVWGLLAGIVAAVQAILVAVVTLLVAIENAIAAIWTHGGRRLDVPVTVAITFTSASASIWLASTTTRTYTVTIQAGTRCRRSASSNE